MQAKPSLDNQSVWQIDRSTSVVKFSVKKLLFLTVNGRLAELDGSIVFDADAISNSSVEATLAAATVDTGNKKRDTHLRSASFLDSDKFPHISFQSTAVKRGKDRDMLMVEGALTIRDTSKDIVLVVTEIDRSKSPDGKEVLYYIAETELDRYDFGINAWRGVIGPKIKVAIDVQANRV
jgi:polyisoprenoid-binding protein YceI